jgi:hypothetical protein
MYFQLRFPGKRLGTLGAMVGFDLLGLYFQLWKQQARTFGQQGIHCFL